MRDAGTPPAVRTVVVGAQQAGQRIDNFLLTRLRGVPRSHVYRLLRSGQVRVNGGRIRAAYRLAAGDRVRVPPVRTSGQGAPVPGALVGSLDGRVLMEDASLLCLDKPAGMAVHGGSGISWGVIEIMRASRPDLDFLELGHRLDRDTSGCLVLAKSRPALRALHRCFREGAVDKWYLALLLGAWGGGARRADMPLETRLHRNGERHVVVAESGKAAVTDFRPLRRFRAATLTEVCLGTGRTHQIRVHAAALGHPVAGDRRYGDAQRNAELRLLGLRRLFLHACRLRLRLNEGGPEYDCRASLPEDLQVFLDQLAPA